MHSLLHLLPLFASFLLVFSTDIPEHDQSLIWGTYRPNLYFGVKPRFPLSLMTGLVWFGTQDFQSFIKARHACNQDDNLDSYTFTHHDPREGSVEVIKDGLNNLHLAIEWLKVPGGDHGGSWVARFKGEPLNQDLPLRTSLVWYLGMEGLGGLDLDNDEDENGLEGPITFSGASPELGEFVMRVVDGPRNEFITDGAHARDFKNKLEKTHYYGIKVPPGSIWQAKDLILKNILQSAQALLPKYSQEEGPPDPSFVLQLPDETFSGSNLFAVQKTYNGPFQFDVFYESASSKQKLDAFTMTQGMEAFKTSFERRFKSSFPIVGSFNDSYRLFSQDITSNLFGGVGYFYGDSIIDHAFVQEWDRDEDEEDNGDSVPGSPVYVDAQQLLTATPSRSFFPRGFYWDEGFHLLHIGEWDNDLSLEILRDWFNLIDENGWVGREQILGAEARSKVPQEFIAQYPTYANPPTLAMAVTALTKRLRLASGQPSDADLGMDSGMQIPIGEDPSPGQKAANRHLDSPVLAQEFLVEFYPKLKRHYEWFRRTQRGHIKRYGRQARSRSEAYRWRGRSATHVLTSGLDDYPRGPPHAGELHLDLISWMGFFTRTMKDIASFMGNTEDAAEFEDIEKSILQNIDDLHWSEEMQMYCDVNVNTDDESYHECHKGYVSIFPLLLGLISPNSPHLGHVLDLIRDPAHLWSDFGLRSLSTEHPSFGKDENYWRGNIWIQMNYLALSSLHKIYAAEPGPYREKAQATYVELRNNVVSNTFKEYTRTGYVWEQYDATTGEGRRSHPFTGWTSLVTLILAEKY